MGNKSELIEKELLFNSEMSSEPFLKPQIDKVIDNKYDTIMKEIDNFKKEIDRRLNLKNNNEIKDPIESEILNQYKEKITLNNEIHSDDKILTTEISSDNYNIDFIESQYNKKIESKTDNKNIKKKNLIKSKKKVD